MSWNGIKTPIAAQPTGLSYYFPIWSQWSPTVVRAHSLFLLVQSEKKEIANQVNGKLIQSMMKRKNAGLSQLHCCRAGNMMFPHFLDETTGSRICWHDSMESVPNPVF